MPSAMLTVCSPIRPIPTACAVPDALQQFLDKLEGWALVNQCRARFGVAENLRSLKQDTERKWQIAAYHGYTSSATLAEILEGGWKQWKQING